MIKVWEQQRRTNQDCSERDPRGKELRASALKVIAAGMTSNTSNDARR